MQKTIFITLSLAGALALAAGCTDGTGAGDGGAHDAAPDAWVAPFDPTVCGARPHAWLPPASMGRVVSKTRSQLYSLPREALEGIIKLTDYKDVVKIRYGATVYLVRYETQDRGKKVEATAALGIPDVPAGGAPLTAPYVLWLHGTSGFSDKCAPTYTQAEGALPAALMASQGYIGVAPDFIGMNGFGAPSTVKHPYLVSEPTALGSLDALRAARAVVTETAKQVTPDARVVLWGASQGGHATLSTALYAPYYAPEFPVVAGLPLIVPADMVAQARAALATFSGSTVLLSAAFVGAYRWYGYSGRLDEVLTDTPPHNFASLIPRLMDTRCSFDPKTYNLTRVTDLYQQAFVDAVANSNWKGYERWRCMLAESSLTRTSVKRRADPPMLYVVSEYDELVDSASQRVSFDTLCKMGYRLQYLECKGANHVQGATWSLPEQFAWVQQRLAGKPLGSTCKRAAATCCQASDKPPCKN